MKWRQIRVPEELAERLDRLADKMEQAYANGILSIEFDERTGKIPKHAIISKALDELEGHLRRSKKRRRTTRVAATRVKVVCFIDVLALVTLLNDKSATHWPFLSR